MPQTKQPRDRWASDKEMRKEESLFLVGNLFARFIEGTRHSASRELKKFTVHLGGAYRREKTGRKKEIASPINYACAFVRSRLPLFVESRVAEEERRVRGREREREREREGKNNNFP